MLAHAAPLLAFTVEPASGALDVAWVLGRWTDSCESTCGACQSHCMNGATVWPTGFSWSCDRGVGHECHNASIAKDGDRYDLAKDPHCGWDPDPKAKSGSNCTYVASDSRKGLRFCPCAASRSGERHNHGSTPAKASTATRRPQPPAPRLPAPWEAIWSKQHEAYYYWNVDSDATQWTRPGAKHEHHAGKEREGKDEKKEKAKLEDKAERPLGKPCTSKEECLKIVDKYLERQPRQENLLMRTYGPGSLGGGSCGDLCELPEPCPSMDIAHACRYDTYDNAVAAIYYTKRGSLEKARGILDIFIDLFYPKSLDGIPDEALYMDLPSGRTMTLLAAAYSDQERARPGHYEGNDVYDGGVDTGNNAWAALAFAHYAAATQSSCYASVARDILHALTSGSTRCKDGLGGFMGRLDPGRQYYRSTEHNVDVAALARVLGEDEVWAVAHRFVHSMYGRNTDFDQSYSMGTGGQEMCDHSQPKHVPVPADCLYWNLLADADPNARRMAEALRFAVGSPEAVRNSRNMSDVSASQGLWTRDKDPLHEFGDLEGSRFSTAGNGVQWEVTASAAMAMLHYERRYSDGAKAKVHVSQYVNRSRNALRRLLGAYGGVPASVLGGNRKAWVRWTQLNQSAQFPGGSDTGLSWSYLRYQHVASTAWTGLLLLYQADEHEKLNEDANPMATPTRPIPTGKDLTCLPPKILKTHSPTTSRSDASTSSRSDKEEYAAWRCWKRKYDHWMSWKKKRDVGLEKRRHPAVGTSGQSEKTPDSLDEADGEAKKAISDAREDRQLTEVRLMKEDEREKALDVHLGEYDHRAFSSWMLQHVHGDAAADSERDSWLSWRQSHQGGVEDDDSVCGIASVQGKQGHQPEEKFLLGDSSWHAARPLRAVGFFLAAFLVAAAMAGAAFAAMRHVGGCWRRAELPDLLAIWRVSCREQPLKNIEEEPLAGLE